MSASLTRGSAKLTSGKRRSARALDHARSRVQPVVRVVEEALEARAGAERVGHAVAVEVDQPDLRVVEVEARRLRGSAGTSARSQRPSKLQREVAATRAGGDQQVGAAVAVGVEELHAGVAEAQPGRRLAHRRAAGRSGRRRGCASSARVAVHLEDVGQAVAEQVDQLEVAVGQRARRQVVAAAARKNVRLSGREARVANSSGGSCFGAVGLVVMADDGDPAEQRGAVACAPRRVVGIGEVVAAHEPLPSASVRI